MTVTAAEVTHPGLTPLESQILEMERDWWRAGAAKDELIRERFGISATRYYQQLNILIDKHQALEADPVLVRRLRRMRRARQEARSSSRGRARR